MPTIDQQINDVCAFLHRFLSGERGFTTSDVRAGIARLRELEPQISHEASRTACGALVRDVGVKLDSAAANPLPRSGVRS
jgi:hypothetical protein